MPKNLNWFDRLIRILMSAVLFFSAAYLFHNSIARIAAAAFGLLELVEAVVGICPLFNWLGNGRFFFGWLGQNKLSAEANYLVGLIAIQCVLAYDWWSAGFGKISSGAFVAGLPKTLATFANQNPFPWVKNFLLGFATSNATAFGQLVQWSEATIGVVLVLAGISYVYSKHPSVRKFSVILSVLALFGAIIMNVTYYFAAGWISLGVKSINLIMFWTEAILAYTWLRSRMS